MIFTTKVVLLNKCTQFRMILEQTKIANMILIKLKQKSYLYIILRTDENSNITFSNTGVLVSSILNGVVAAKASPY